MSEETRHRAACVTRGAPHPGPLRAPLPAHPTGSPTQNTHLVFGDFREASSRRHD